MGYTEHKETLYKVGDMLYGKNSINAKVLAVHATGAIDIQLVTSQPGKAYYYFSAPYRTEIRKEPDQWLLMPNDRILRNISMNTNVQFRLIHDTVQTKECSSISWWGNLYGNDMFYGNPPYGHYYIPRDTSQKVPIKDCPESEWRQDFGLGSEWKRVPGSYRWHQSGNVGDYYGWLRRNNYGPYLNRYAKRITMTFSKGSTSEFQSGHIKIDKIKVTIKTYVPEPIDSYVYRTPKKAASEITYHNLAIKKNPEFIKLNPYPAVNRFSIPDDAGSDILNFAWTSKEDEDASKNVYDKVTVNFKDAYTGAASTFTVEGNALTGNLTIPEAFGGQAERLAGRYEYTINATFDGKSTQKTSQKFIVEVYDDNDPVTPEFKDKNNPKIVYNMVKDITTLAHTPKWDVVKNHKYSATYDYYEYENEGYDCRLKESRVQFKNGETTFKADGQYHIRLTATYRNGKSVSIQSVFMIDTRHPRRPVINISGDDYEGLFLKEEKLKKTYLNNAVAKITSPPFTRNIIDIYFKKMASGEFERVGKNKLPDGGLFNRIGTWKIVAKCEKTEVTYEDGSPLVSETSEVIFAVKKKYTNDINLTSYILDRDIETEEIRYTAVPSKDEGKIKAYKVEAAINFTDSLTDSGNMDMRFILDSNGNKIKNADGTYKVSMDFTGMDSTLNKLYKVDNGEWKYYLDKIFIYNNCTIECKSVDDDGFESYTTVKKISNFDATTVPPKLVITNLSNGSIIETGNRIIIGEQ